MAHFLIVTDLDATLLGNHQRLEDFNRLFTEHRNRHPKSKLVYATGRSLYLYQELEDPQVGLLVPDMLITSVGSEIYTIDKQDRKKHIDDEWEKHISENWNVERVKQITSEYKKQLKPQSELEQGKCKVSFLLKPQDQYILEELEQKFRKEDIHAQVIYSSNRDVDVLPERSGKGNALSYVRKKLEMPCDRTVACGDSGNDIALFTDTSIYGVIVGNARPELREWYRNNRRTTLHLANMPFASGILEGLHHFGWLG